jgi:stress response protein YsnF
MRTIYGLFDDHESAERAAEAVEKAGVRAEHISILTNADKAKLAGLRSSALERDADLYLDCVEKDGSTLVMVDSEEGEISRTADILARYGMVDVDQRAEAYGKEDVLRGDKDSDRVLKVIQESPEVGKREVERRKVRVFNRITSKEVEEKVGLRHETIHVERRAVDRPVEADLIEELFTERSFEVHEIDEEPVVSKVARVLEEVGVLKTEREHEPVVAMASARPLYEPPRSETHEPAMLRDVAVEVPRHETYEVPRHETYEVPRHETYEVPRHETYEVPRHETYEVPRHETYEVPPDETYEVWCHDMYEVPRDDTYEVWYQDMYEVPRPETYEARRRTTYEAPYRAFYEPPRREVIQEGPRREIYETPRPEFVREAPRRILETTHNGYEGSIDHYELTPEQERVVSRLGNSLRWTSLPLISLGLLVVINLAMYAIWLWRRGEFDNLLLAALPLFLLGLSIMLFGIGAWVGRAGTSFLQIARTSGNDMAHLMSALGHLDKVWGVIAGFAKALILLTVLALLFNVIHIWRERDAEEQAARSVASVESRH